MYEKLISKGQKIHKLKGDEGLINAAQKEINEK